MLDVLDETGEATGEVAPKDEAHRLGLWHRCFHCWIVDPGGPYLFVQRRAAGKETWPGRLDVSAAGHLRAGEEVLDGLREVEEELGLVAPPGELMSLGTRRIEREIPGVGIDREFQEAFLLVKTLSPEDLCLQREEVAAILRLRLEDVEALREGTEVAAEEWTYGEARPSRTSCSDFVPEEDGYLSRIARAARDALAGRRPGPIF